jgi:hypothetical protein
VSGRLATDRRDGLRGEDGWSAGTERIWEVGRWSTRLVALSEFVNLNMTMLMEYICLIGRIKDCDMLRLMSDYRPIFSPIIFLLSFIVYSLLLRALTL